MSLMMASSAAALAMALQTAPEVHYQLSITEGTDTRPVVTVELRFDGETDGSTDLYLPDNWGGETELWNGIQSLVAEGADISQGDQPRVRVLTHAPGAALTVRYQLVQDWQGVPNAEQSNYRPILQPGFLHLIGNTWIAEPDLGPDKTVTMSLQAPEGWALASDMQHGVSTMDDIMSSVLVAGDYQVLTTELDGAAIRTGIRGEGWPMSEQAFAAMQSTAYLINVARGGCVDQDALIKALDAQQIAGAGIDVTEPEPLPSDSRLWTFENVILTPHSGGETRSYEDNVVDILIDNLERLWRGEQELRHAIV